MSDIFGDHPDRPDTPEFWALSETVLRNDGAVEDEGTEGFIRIFKELIDPEIVAYMGVQRSTKFLQEAGLHPALLSSPEFMSTVSALWMDGFAAGGQYAKRHPKESE